MAFWDSKNQKIVYFQDRPCHEYPGWIIEDCGCCGGIKWGGDYPIECNCNSGFVFKHKKSGVRALYPGGSFI